MPNRGKDGGQKASQSTSNDNVVEGDETNASMPAYGVSPQVPNIPLYGNSPVLTPQRGPGDGPERSTGARRGRQERNAM